MRYLEVDGIGKVSSIGLGTWQFGSREWGYGDGYAAGGARDVARAFPRRHGPREVRPSLTRGKRRGGRRRAPGDDDRHRG